VLASVCIGLLVVVLKGQGVLLTAVTAGTVYVGVLLALALWSTGSVHQLKAKYLL
jgi:hypothetical protein